jgi:HK97 family phage portal protein
MNIFKQLFQKAAKATGMKNLLNRILYQMTGQVSYLLDANIENYINHGYKGNVHVYSVTTAIMQRITGIPFKHMMNDKEIVNSELIKLLNNPNPMQSQDEFIEAYAGWMLLTGNAYQYNMSPDEGLNKGKPVETYWLPSQFTEIIGGGITEPVKGYRINIGHGYSFVIPAEKVIHYKYFNPGADNNGAQLYGQSPLEAGFVSVQAGNDGAKALSRAYQHGHPAGILTGTKDEGLEYTEEQITKLNERWERKFGGAENYKKMLFSRNPMQWIEMGYSVIDMNIIESMKYSLQDVCNLYHAPPYLFSTDAATLDNYKEARKAIYTDCVIPLLDKFISKANKHFTSIYQAGSRLDYDTSVITELNVDVQAMATALSQTWWLTGNERRGMMGVEESADPMMDEILFPNALIPGSEMQATGMNDLSL